MKLKVEKKTREKFKTGNKTQKWLEDNKSSESKNIFFLKK